MNARVLYEHVPIPGSGWTRLRPLLRPICWFLGHRIAQSFVVRPYLAMWFDCSRCGYHAAQTMERVRW